MMDASDQELIRTSRLGSLTHSQLQAALSRFDLGTVVSVRPTTDGLFGQNVFVSSDTGEWVLRGAPHFPWQFPTERFFARLLHERTSAPVPWPYHFDPTEDIFGWSYALMPRMPGHSFTEHVWFATLTMDDRVAIAAAMGDTLADVHTLTWPVEGEYDADADDVRPFPRGYGAWVIERIEEMLVDASAWPRHTQPTDVAWARSLIEAGRQALDVPFQPCAVMEDYHPGNVTIVRVDENWRVGGVFDLLSFRFGDGEVDLARLGRMYAYEEPRLAAAFIRAYQARWPARAGFSLRFPIYLLYDSLIIWRFCLLRDDIWWSAGYTVRDWVEETLAIFRGQSLLDA